MDILKVSTSNSSGTYLGCRNIDRKRASVDGKLENLVVNFHLKKKFSSKLARWKARFLSQAGKMVLIKLNVAGIPLFT